MQWDPDRALQARMAVVIGLLALMPAAFVVVMDWAIANVIVPVVAVFAETRIAWEFTASLPALAVVTGVGLVGQYVVGDRFALRAVEASPVESDAYPEVRRQLTRLSQQADLPTPQLAVSPSRVPNAFATGRTQESATVVLTEGALDALSDAELEAVLAHEIAHVKNRDAMVMAAASLLPAFTYLVASVAYTLLGWLWQVAGHVRHADSDEAKPLVAVLAVFTVSSLVTIAVSALFWAGSFLLVRVLSRERERAADDGAARITGDPLALATALETIDETQSSLPDRDLREIDGGVEALYVVPLDVPTFTDGEPGLVSHDLFPDTHPPTDERIDRLQELATRLETDGS